MIIYHVGLSENWLPQIPLVKRHLPYEVLTLISGSMAILSPMYPKDDPKDILFSILYPIKKNSTSLYMIYIYIWYIYMIYIYMIYIYMIYIYMIHIYIYDIYIYIWYIYMIYIYIIYIYIWYTCIYIYIYKIIHIYIYIPPLRHYIYPQDIAIQHSSSPFLQENSLTWPRWRARERRLGARESTGRFLDGWMDGWMDG